MFRKYSKDDKTKVVELLRLNTPDFFAPFEESDFTNYLDHEAEDYFVVEKDSEIIGCGGINYFTNERIARISWDMIHPHYQGKGIGKKLTQYRVNYIEINSAMERIVVRTTQRVYKFYEKMGFELEKVERDYWAKDFDLYQMTLKIHR